MQKVVGNVGLLKVRDLQSLFRLFSNTPMNWLLLQFCSVRFGSVWFAVRSVLAVQSLSSAGENIAVAIAMQKFYYCFPLSVGFPKFPKLQCLPCRMAAPKQRAPPGQSSVNVCLHRKLACIELISSSCVK